MYVFFCAQFTFVSFGNNYNVTLCSFDTQSYSYIISGCFIYFVINSFKKYFFLCKQANILLARSKFIFKSFSFVREIIVMNTIEA